MDLWNQVVDNDHTQWMTQLEEIDVILIEFVLETLQGRGEQVTE